jgi:hypothetical protein
LIRRFDIVLYIKARRFNQIVQFREEIADLFGSIKVASPRDTGRLAPKDVRSELIQDKANVSALKCVIVALALWTCPRI